MSRIAILGSGAWGTAMALSLARCESRHGIVLWSYSATTASALSRQRENSRYLPGFPLPDQVRNTHSLADAVGDAEQVLFVVPSEYVRSVCSAASSFFQPGQALISATKGLEDRTYLRVSQILGEVTAARRLRSPIAVLSGPSFAKEVAHGLPAALTVASSDAAFAAHLQHTWTTPSLRLYTNDDVIGVELGGALKNVIAIATGIAAGLELGHNAIAALITRGIAEVTRLATACGGKQETLAGLSGIGDLVLTCTGALSRNRTVGLELGRGRPLGEVMLALDGKVAEGVRTTSAAVGLAQRHGVELPITEQMNAILHLGKNPRDAMRDLMARPGRDE